MDIRVYAIYAYIYIYIYIYIIYACIYGACIYAYTRIYLRVYIHRCQAHIRVSIAHVAHMRQHTYLA